MSSTLNSNDPIIKLKLAKLAKLEQMQAEREKFPHRHMHKWYGWGRDFYEDWTTKRQILTAANQLGKVQQYHSLTLTPKGFVEHGTLKVGDQVIGEDGRPCNIIDIPWRGEDEFYELEFDDGTTVTAGQDHMWRCKGAAQRFGKSYRGKTHYSETYGQWVEFSTKEMYEKGRYWADNHKPINRFVLPYVEPVHFEEKNLFDPYALGVLLGDGSFPNSRVAVTVTNPEDNIKNYLEQEHMARGKWAQNKNCYTISMPTAVKYILSKLDLIGTVSDTKFVPEQYLLGSIDQRLKLLQGLLDTDGTVSLDGTIVEYNSASERLALAVEELVFSLGGTCKKTVKKAYYTYQGDRLQGKDSHRLRIKLPPKMAPFRFAKGKLERWQKSNGAIRYKHERVIRRITPIGKREGMCISVDSPHACYVTGKNYVVTHNSSTVIKKLIEMAVSPERWADVWPDQMAVGQKPTQWWYLYPTKDVATVEFNEKWVPLLPKVDPDDPKYGWKVKKGSYATVHSVSFNTGVTIYFKAYKQEVSSLQSGSASVVTGDEEVPVALLPELQMRTSATNGFMFFVFTATMGQKFWREVVEERTKWPDARVWQVSLYDSMKYEDGTPSMWTKDRIEAAKRSCISEAEVQRRIMGKFVVDSGLLFPHFDEEKHVKEYHPIPEGWEVYAGLDYGTGGGPSAHPASIVVCGINPEHTKVRVIRMWRGDRQSTTAQDIVDTYLEMTKGLKVITAYYDYGPGGRDIGTIATRMGLPFEPANKGTDVGRGILQSLIKADALIFYSTDDPGIGQYLETGKMIDELITAVDKPDKRSQNNDDLCLAEGTLILTKRGQVAIEHVNENDQVLTREGWRKVLFSGQTGVSDVYQVGPVQATLGHPFAAFPSSGKGVEWVKTEDLTSEDELYSFANLWQSLSFSTGLSTEDTPSQKTYRIRDILQHTLATRQKALAIYTGTCGYIKMGLFPKATMSIMWMVISIIMILATFALFVLMSTLAFIQKSAGVILITGQGVLSIWNSFETKLLSGTGLKRASTGISSTQELLLRKRQEPFFRRLVRFALKPLTWTILTIKALDFAQTNAGRRTVEILGLITKIESVWFAGLFLGPTNILKSKVVLKSAPKLSGKDQKVYNLKIDKTPEYFANGVLVHNCDALRYCLSKIGFDWDALGHQTEEKPAVIKTVGIDELRRMGDYEERESMDEVAEEMEFWQSMLEA